MKQDKRLIISFSLNVLVAFLVIVGIVVMICFGDDVLGSRSWSVFKYFTFQSNVFVGIIASIYACFQLLIIRQKKDKIPHVLNVFNHAAITAVGLTFVIVVTVLGPGYGYDKMYNKANLFFHALVPLTAMINFMFFEKEARVKFIETLFSLIHPFLYGVVYFIVVASLNAYGDLKIDFYGFGKDGPLLGAVYFLAILAIAYTVGLFLYFINNVVFKKRK